MLQKVEEKIAGEITISDNPGETIRKWREEFRVARLELAKYLEISPSVISDYESGRRKSPGVSSIKKIVNGLVAIDKKRGGHIVRRYSSGMPSEALLAIQDYDHEVSLDKIIKVIDGTSVADVSTARHVRGYTIVDGIRAILDFSYSEYSLLYGWSSQRVICFTEVKFGRSPMIAIRVHPLKPAAVVYVRAGKVDDLAVKLAEIEGIPLITTEMDAHRMSEILSAIK